MTHRITSERVIAAVLVGLVALTAGLVFQARSIERSHRATADNALRDYAALASWQYSERIQTELAAMASAALFPIHDYVHNAQAPERLAAPAVLLGVPHDACLLAIKARFAFRIDVKPGTAIFAGQVPDVAIRDSIVSRLAKLALLGPVDREIRRLMVVRLGGELRAIAYGFVRRGGQVQAIYGIESSASVLQPTLTQAFRDKELLPRSLLRGRSVNDALALTVHAPDMTALASFGSDASSALSATTTTNVTSGELITRVVLNPSATATLLIGGAPTSRLPMMMGFLVGSMLLAGIALVQMRRGRELARLRTRFVANVSHELRTPLAQISMFSETLLLGRERSRDESREFLSVIFREARRLSYLVESVLSFSRSESAPRARATLSPVDVSDEVGEALHAFTPIAAASEMTIAADLEEEAIAIANSHALRQVLINLLDNAVKFGAAGQTISVSVRHTGGEILLAVEDEGPGVPASERLRVFQPFAQGTAGSNARGATGAGIGLAVVAELTREMRGRIWIEDRAGEPGARVVCALRAERATEMMPEGAQARPLREPAIAT